MLNEIKDELEASLLVVLLVILVRRFSELSWGVMELSHYYPVLYTIGIMLSELYKFFHPFLIIFTYT